MNAIYLKPELVRKTGSVKTESMFEDSYPDIIKYIECGEYTDIDILGDATIAKVEAGKKTVGKAVDRIVTFLKSYFSQ